jgi:hypothetical protein
MAINPQYPSTNDFAPSWADIVLTISVNDGPILETIDFAGIKYDSKVTVGAKKGASGGRKMARTVGEIEHSGSITLYKDGWRKLQRALAAVAPSRGNQKLLSLVAFSVLVQFTPPGETDIYSAELKGCRVIGHSHDTSEGSDAVKIEVELDIIEIVEKVDGVEITLL